MKWMEMIRVRSSAGSADAAAPLLAEETRELGKVAGVSEALVLRHTLYGGDLAVVLVWDDARKPVKTREGLLMAQGMQRYGSVDHAVWKQEPRRRTT